MEVLEGYSVRIKDRIKVGIKTLFLLLLLVSSVTCFAEESISSGRKNRIFDGKYQPDISIGVVQFHIDRDTYKSVKNFKSRIGYFVNEISSKIRPDLIVFPEYTSVFIALIPYHRIVESSVSFKEAFAKLKRLNGKIESMKDIFIDNEEFVRRVMDETFGKYARDNSTYIIAGTYFHWDTSSSSLKNRVVVYGPEGNIIYFQDKVFLTDFERNIIGLSPGKLSDAEGFYIGNIKIAMTICKDTFESVWSDKYSGYDVWVDIKANGTSYNSEEAESFLRALPARLKENGVPLGITDCLTGRYLDLFWEGESSIIHPVVGNDSDKNVKIIFLKRSGSCDKGEILYYNGYE